MTFLCLLLLLGPVLVDFLDLGPVVIHLLGLVLVNLLDHGPVVIHLLRTSVLVFVLVFVLIFVLVFVVFVVFVVRDLLLNRKGGKFIRETEIYVRYLVEILNLSQTDERIRRARLFRRARSLERAHWKGALGKWYTKLHIARVTRVRQCRSKKRGRRMSLRSSREAASRRRRAESRSKRWEKVRFICNFVSHFSN